MDDDKIVSHVSSGARTDLENVVAQEFEALVYQQKDTVRYLVLDLIWKPAHGILRFFLIETPRERFILMSSDLTLEALQSP